MLKGHDLFILNFHRHLQFDDAVLNSVTRTFNIVNHLAPRQFGLFLERQIFLLKKVTLLFYFFGVLECLKEILL